MFTNISIKIWLSCFNTSFNTFKAVSSLCHVPLQFMETNYSYFQFTQGVWICVLKLVMISALL
ncbi:hypothetical protein HanHA300_Chr08g0283831 [Helianthus annuus]|nr:hypothetical protein HanHA300_Chr08g0283831 [Helianthus annuus]